MIAAALVTGACQSQQQRQAERRRVEQDRDSAAFKAGQAAHKVATATGKVAAAAGRRIGEGVKKAHEGWKDQAQQDRNRKQQ